MKIANAIFLLATLSSAAAHETPMLRASVLIGGVAVDDVDVDVDTSSHQNDIIANEAGAADEIEKYVVDVECLHFCQVEDEYYCEPDLRRFCRRLGYNRGGHCEGDKTYCCTSTCASA